MHLCITYIHTLGHPSCSWVVKIYSESALKLMKQWPAISIGGISRVCANIKMKRSHITLSALAANLRRCAFSQLV